jgi:YkoY family integral membrane protein
MDILHSILGPDLGAAFGIILSLVLIESLLSVDNAAVLATMVLDLPKEQRAKALRYGIIGAYFFRGLCLLLAEWLITIWWLKPIGGIYLLYLAFSYFKGLSTPKDKSDDVLDKKQNWFYRMTVGQMGIFWATVALVELMDLAFSLDNVFAAVAFVENYPQPQGLYLVWIGVFIGILAMRFVAQAFVNLMERFPFLEASAFVVIGILGVKLSLSLYIHYYEHTPFAKFLESESTDIVLSLLTFAVFLLPILSSILFKWPKGTKIDQDSHE